jgi:AraC-like DNA-binding protein
MYTEGIEKALKFMEVNYGRKVSLQEIATESCMSKFHFCRVFKKVKGISCFQYLNQLKIGIAAQMLKSTDLSITQIALESGYNDLRHFERIFKHVTGNTPYHFRKHLRENNMDAITDWTLVYKDDD